ncbi:hypothetical protein ACFPRL_04205 [Pseudoclavibacter helvolus]
MRQVDLCHHHAGCLGRELVEHPLRRRALRAERGREQDERGPTARLGVLGKEVEVRGVGCRRFARPCCRIRGTLQASVRALQHQADDGRDHNKRAEHERGNRGIHGVSAPSSARPAAG